MAETVGRLKWDQTGQRLYETGVKKGVLFPMNTSGAYGNGVAWNGLTGVSEAPTGAEPTALYADDIKYLNLMSNEEWGGTITAYTYPDEFAECDGSAAITPGVNIGQQTRKQFGFSYVTTKGNDTDGTEYGYIIHLVYGALASPSQKDYATINDSPEAIEFSWEISTTPVEVPGFKPTATITIDSTKVNAEKLKAFEDILYGKDAGEGGTPAAAAARLPLPSEIITLFPAE